MLWRRVCGVLAGLSSSIGDSRKHDSRKHDSRRSRSAALQSALTGATGATGATNITLKACVTQHVR